MCRWFESNRGSQRKSTCISMSISFISVGLESRLLATVRWTVATGVAFPQKSESNRGSQKEIDMIFHVDFFMPVGLRKAALTNCPVDCCNQPGFLQKSESNRGLRIDALFILRYFLEKFVFKIEISFGCVSGKMMLQCHLGMNCGFLWYFCMCIFSHTELRGK